MAALTNDNPRDLQVLPASTVIAPVAASQTIHKGALVMINSAGFVVEVATGAANVFFGMALTSASDITTAGDKSVEVLVTGQVRFELSTAAQAHLGDTFYATNDNDITTDAGTGGVNVEIGKCVAVNVGESVTINLTA